MPSFSGLAAMRRAQADIGKKFLPQGMCLNHNFVWSGVSGSVGPGQGHYGTAMDAWNYATKKVLGDRNPPPGVPLYFGVSPTRTDANKAAGDVGWSVGGGIGVFTDSQGAYVGPLTIAAREKETQRPYLGWARDFLGWDIAEQVAVTTSTIITTPASAGTTTVLEDDDMPYSQDDIRALVGDAMRDPKNLTAISSAVLDVILQGLQSPQNVAILHATAGDALREPNNLTAIASVTLGTAKQAIQSTTPLPAK